MNQAKQYCSFAVADACFGVDVQVVQEVIRYQEMTRVPLAPGEVSGLINLRGQIVTAVDLRRRLGLPDRGEGVRPMNVVVRTGDGAVSLLVDEIGDVVEPDPASFEPPPDILAGTTREVVVGIHKLRDRLLLILDTRATLHLSGHVADVA